MKSMTGYGEGEAKGAFGRCSVQIQSVNGRYFKLTANIPREIAPLEPRIRGFLQERTGRGQVTAYLVFTPPEGSMERVVIDRRACKELAAQFRKISSWLRLEGGLDLRTLVNTGAIVRTEMVSLSRKPVWGLVRRALAAACEDFAKSQEREGLALANDFVRRWRKVDSLIAKIDLLRAGSARRYEEKIRGKVRTVLEGASYDEGRLLAEVSIYADRVDITEEIVRLRSHMKGFRRLLSAAGEIGKKLDFTMQEIQREVNTSANKANDARISGLAIEIKAEMEKIREQLQNVQ
jgi:uncharacterized protein (TIGR00255 family)